MTLKKLEAYMPMVALGLLVGGAYTGLWVAPKERAMGDVYRIMFVHVPAAWLTLVAYTVTLIASLVFLLGEAHDRRADALAAASAEVGVVFNLLLLITGSIWGRPTWGVWWSWDPRLTTAAIMLFLFAGYLALRQFVDDPQRRATWGALVAIVIFADIPIVWFSVKWFNSLHQLQSSPKTMAPTMVNALRLNAFAFLAVYGVLTRWRYRLLWRQQALEMAPPPAPGGAS